MSDDACLADTSITADDRNSIPVNNSHNIYL